VQVELDLELCLCRTDTTGVRASLGEIAPSSQRTVMV
jgi:hypothetical protein